MKEMELLTLKQRRERSNIITIYKLINMFEVIDNDELLLLREMGFKMNKRTFNETKERTMHKGHKETVFHKEYQNRRNNNSNKCAQRKII